jgi:hypothetical protein
MTCTQGLTAEEMARASLQVSMDLNADQRLLEDVSICSVAKRVMALEQRTESFGLALAENTSMTEENTRITTEIKEDTATLIELVMAGRKVGRAGRLMGRAFAWFYKFFLKFILPVIIGLAAVVAAVKATKP